MNKYTLLQKVKDWPQAFQILPISDQKPDGTWAAYPLDNVVQFWVNSSHPEAINFYKIQIKINREYEMNKALTVQEEKNIGTLLSNNMKAIQSILPQHLTPEKAARLLYGLLVKNPALGRCTQPSIMNCFLEASALGLEIGGALHHASLIPFNNRRAGTSEAALVVEYNGKIMLAQNTGNVKNVSAHAVYEKDDFRYVLGLRPDIHHIPCDLQEPGPLTHAYAVINYTNGGQDFEVINEKVAMEAKGRSAAKFKKDSPWNQKDLEYQQWKKTAIHRLMNRVPKSAEKIVTAPMDGGNVPNHVIDIKLDDLGSVQIPETTAQPTHEPEQKKQISNDVNNQEQTQDQTAGELIDDTKKKVEKEKLQAITMCELDPGAWAEACEACQVENDIDKMTVRECIQVGAAMSSILDIQADQGE
jgi:recombination protein RecT